MEFSFREIIGIIFSLVISIVAIRISFSFDLNKYLETRKNDFKEKAKNACPHCIIFKKGSNIGIQSTFISPFGTTNFICQKCGLTLYHLDKEQENERMAYWINNIEKFNKQERKFEKLLKKAGVL